jgi:hypothetical protein
MNSNLRRLIRSGRPTADQLQDAWDSIFSEFQILSDNKQSNYLLGLLREYYSIPNKITIIEAIIGSLQSRYEPELIRLLRDMGFRHKYDPESDSYARDLQLTITQSKSLVIRWNDLTSDIKRLEEGNKKNQTEASNYDVILSELSRFQGYRLDAKVISVAEFCAVVKMFRKEAK